MIWWRTRCGNLRPNDFRGGFGAYRTIRRWDRNHFTKKVPVAFHRGVMRTGIGSLLDLMHQVNLRTKKRCLRRRCWLGKSKNGVHG